MSTANLSRINTNIQALNALNALNSINTRLSVHSLRLATGKRVNSAADDAAGFTIASKLKVKSSGLGTVLDNIGSSKNLMTVAEGHLNNIKEILSQMKSKALQAANGTLGSDERVAILEELQEYNSQIDAEVSQAQWAGVDLLSTDKIFQIGVGTSSADELSFNVAESVWGGGTVTTFNSSGLDVVAASTATSAVATNNLATVGMDTANPDVNATLNSLTGELETGHYTVEVTSTGDGVNAAVTIQVRDSEGELVTLDADGTDSGSVATSLSTTVTNVNPGVLNLGVGIEIDLSVVATVAAASGSAIFSIDYTRSGNSVETMENAQAFMDKVDSSINRVNEGLSYIGSMINRLSFQEESISVAKVNTEAAHSRIMDADMAYEQLEATKLMILQQTATAMLAQANVAPQSILALFG